VDTLMRTKLVKHSTLTAYSLFNYMLNSVK